MRAIIGARPGVPAQRVIPGHMAARALERVEALLRKGGAPDRVDDSRTSTPASARSSRALHEAVRDPALLEDVALDVDEAPRLARWRRARRRRTRPPLVRTSTRLCSDQSPPVSWARMRPKSGQSMGSEPGLAMAYGNGFSNSERKSREVWSIESDDRENREDLVTLPLSVVFLFLVFRTLDDAVDEHGFRRATGHPWSASKG